MDRTFTYGFMPSIASILCAELLFGATNTNLLGGVLPSSGRDRAGAACTMLALCCSLSSVSLGHYIVASPFEFSYSVLAHISILTEGTIAVVGLPTAAWLAFLAWREQQGADSAAVTAGTGSAVLAPGSVAEQGGAL